MIGCRKQQELQSAPTPLPCTAMLLARPTLSRKKKTSSPQRKAGRYFWQQPRKLYLVSGSYQVFSISGSQMLISVSRAKNLHFSIFGTKFIVSPSFGFTEGWHFATTFEF